MPRRPPVPPPESDAWPPEYRGARWKRAYGILFAGKCLLCQYSFPEDWTSDKNGVGHPVRPTPRRRR